MITINELEMIQDEELKNLLIKFNSIHRLDDKEFYKISPQNTTHEARIIRCNLAEFIYRRLSNQNVVNALNISNDLKYYKKNEVAKSLRISEFDSDYYSILNSISWMPCGSLPMESLIDFVAEQNIPIDQNTFNSIRSFIKDKSNKNIIGVTPGIYLPLPEEKRLLKEVLDYKNEGYKNAPKELNNYIVKEYNSLEARCIRLETEDEVFKWAKKEINNYQNKRTGNIAEYFFIQKASTVGKILTHISKIYGDGHGYDAISLSPSEEEMYEIKGTLNIENYDSFKISNNEYDVMVDTLGLLHSNYYIPRVFINKNDLSHKSTLLLSPHSDKELRPVDGNGPIYKYHHDEYDGKVFTKQ